ncbi:MAG: cysteine desulfurase family protein [Gammaproteobacteria bacterium WSBS_2016_MAG_OTU1]
MTKEIYLDYNATTPLHPQVLEAMMPFLTAEYGNASSRHSYGRRARQAVDIAREQVAAAVAAHPSEVVFTSSGTESNNTIIKGVALMSLRGVVAVAATEHPCVLCAARSLQRGGMSHIPLAVDENGVLEMDDLKQTVAGDDCALVSVMCANNETGVLQDIVNIAAAVKATGAIMHTDAAQALGKVAIDFAGWGVDAMTLSAHKARGPKGVAALLVRREVDWAPLLEGGGHENGRRSSTENVAGIIGMGAACALSAESLSAAEQLQTWRDEMEEAFLAAGATIFGKNAPRLPNTSLFGFPQLDGESMVVMLDQSGFAVASGAACSSMKDEPSHVLLAMEVAPEMARTAIRASFGAGSTHEEVKSFTAAVLEIRRRLSSMSSLQA